MPTIDWEKLGIVAILGVLVTVFVKLYIASKKDEVRFLRRMLERVLDVNDKQAATLSQLADHVNEEE